MYNIFKINIKVIILSYLKNISFILFFRERGWEREWEGENHRCVRETSMNCLLHAPQLGTWPETQACAMTGNWTGDLSVHGPALNPVSHISHGHFNLFKVYNLVVYIHKVVQPLPQIPEHNPESSYLPIPTSSHALETTGIPSVCMNLPNLEISCKWNHTTCGLLCLASFT